MALLQEIKVPLLSVNDTSLTIIDTPFKTGEKVDTGQVIVVFETSKTSYEVTVETPGYIQYLCSTGDDYEVNEVVVKIFSDSKDIDLSVETSVKKIKKLTPINTKEWNGETQFSSGAKKLLEENELSSDLFKGYDFVSKEDVMAIMVSSPKAKKNKLFNSVSQMPKQTGLDIIDYKISSGKKREIDYLSDVQQAGLTSTVHIYVDTAFIFGHLNNALKALKNSILPLVIYESSRLLKKYPLLNAFYNSDSISVYKDINPGFAIDIGKGLKVLNVKNAGELSIQHIEEKILDLSGKYLDDKLELEHLTDITFTITDLSAEGTFLFKPLVNFMNSSILGISSIDTKLNRCVLSMTFDHRITEGKLVAGFLQELKIRLESYRSDNQSLMNQDVMCFKCRKKLKDNLADVGFSKCITPKGDEAYICQSCFKGY
jgi:pyruvate/2-oxoglutarate dehydrogenase complex dihydrolipoamide acyltransferase (E2) component